MVKISVDIAWDLGVWDKLSSQDTVALIEIIQESHSDGHVIGKFKYARPMED